LQVIMQFVTVEVCASRIFPSAKAPRTTAALIARRGKKNRQTAHAPSARSHSLPEHHSVRTAAAAHDLFGKGQTTPDQVRARPLPHHDLKRRMTLSENRHPLFRITRKTATPS
jgi:hypothetical protein